MEVRCSFSYMEAFMQMNYMNVSYNNFKHNQKFPYPTGSNANITFDTKLKMWICQESEKHQSP